MGRSSAEGALAGTYAFSYRYDKADHRKSIAYPAGGFLPAETVTTNYQWWADINSTIGATDYFTSTTLDGVGRVLRR